MNEQGNLVGVQLKDALKKVRKGVAGDDPIAIMVVFLEDLLELPILAGQRPLDFVEDLADGLLLLLEEKGVDVVLAQSFEDPLLLQLASEQVLLGPRPKVSIIRGKCRCRGSTVKERKMKVK